jgi:lysophospholipase L1-like esterase
MKPVKFPFARVTLLTVLLIAATPVSAAASWKTIIIGDSEARGNTTLTPTSTILGGRAWFTDFLLNAGGSATYLYNAGMPGETSTQQLARFQRDVLDRHPDLLIVQTATTDCPRGVPLATTISNETSMIAQAQRAGIRVALTDLIARASPTCEAAVNDWAQSYAAANGVPLIDLHSQLLDPATGGMLPIYDSGDHIHPNYLGAMVLGQAAAVDLSPILPAPAYLSIVNDDPASLIRDGLFTKDHNNDGRPDNWSLGTSWTVAPAPVGEALTVSALNGRATISQQLPANSTQAGEGLALAARLTGTTGAYTFSLVFHTPTGNYQYAPVGGSMSTLANGFAAISATVPQGTTAVDVQLTVASGSATISQVTLTTVAASGQRHK